MPLHFELTIMSSVLLSTSLNMLAVGQALMNLYMTAKNDATWIISQEQTSASHQQMNIV